MHNPSVVSGMSTTSSSLDGFAAGASEKLEGSVRSAQHVNMFRFILYETASRFFLIGADVLDQKFRVLKIDRTTSNGDLGLSEDGMVYSKSEINELMSTLDEGNRSSGGLKLRCSCWGLLGFIQFTGEHYMLLITKRSGQAMIGGHYVYRIDATELISLASSSPKYKSEAQPEEGRFLSIFNLLDLSNSFYFSYSYDITNTLQHNLAAERKALASGTSNWRERKYNDMFVWNHHLLEPAAKVLSNVYEWCLALVHGFVDQAKLSVLGRPVYVTLIARRSRYFAGARFLKRGANDLGYVANDVETEQIVSEMQTTPFHAPGPQPFANPSYTSYVQHRGSIPLHWSQDNSGVSPKPAIDLNLVDPFYTAAALHFNNLFSRYGAPIYVLNLVKSRERTPRESKLLKEYTAAINYLNQFLPPDKEILYKAWDMSRASKTNQNVIQNLEFIAEGILATTGFFRNGSIPGEDMTVQNGVARTNCIDCLDRTNAAQSVIGKVALGHQLRALGILDTSLNYDTDAVNLFTHMYHNHGDTIAIQYGGSHLVNTMETYRKTNQWSSQSRDMVESLKRFVNNSFLDAQRQEAYNLFLGNYIYAQGQPMLWELPSDYHLHHSDPRRWAANRKRNYINWYRNDLLEDRAKLMAPLPLGDLSGVAELDRIDDYWREYYRPSALTSFGKVFASKLQSTLEYIPYRSTSEGTYNPSPFQVRKSMEQQEVEEKSANKKGITIVEPASRDMQSSKRRNTVPVAKVPSELSFQTENLRPRTEDEEDRNDKSVVTQRALNQLVKGSLHPSMTVADLEEYSQYMTHPLNLALAASGEEVTSPQAFEYANYIQTPDSFDNPDVLQLLEGNAETYTEYLVVEDEPLTVREGDLPKKRYTAYRKWLRGKSLFKQSRIDPDAIPRIT